MTTWTSEDRENAMKKEEEEYSGGIPIPFAGWMQQDKENTETMLRHQLQILQAEIEALKAKTLTNEEINKIAQEHGVIVDAGVYEFAKAILRKAQEK